MVIMSCRLCFVCLIGVMSCVCGCVLMVLFSVRVSCLVCCWIRILLCVLCVCCRCMLVLCLVLILVLISVF